jgi:hypothetical protein
MSNVEHARNLVLLGALGALLGLAPLGLSLYLTSFVLFTMMYVVLALSWNIIKGRASSRRSGTASRTAGSASACRAPTPRPRRTTRCWC